MTIYITKVITDKWINNLLSVYINMIINTTIQWKAVDTLIFSNKVSIK